MRVGTVVRFFGCFLLVCFISTRAKAVVGWFPHEVFPVGEAPLVVLVVDLNGDGYPDVVTANDQSDDVSILLGDGDGGLTPFATIGPVAISWSQHTDLASGDFNTDGIPDLVLGTLDLTLFLGLGDGSFAPAQQIVTQVNSRGVAVADFNGDGKDDIAHGALSILLGNGDGTFQAETSYATGFAYRIVVGDFNEDNALDLVTPNVSTDDVSLLLGNGDGTFAPEVRFAVGDGPLRIAAGDFDGDGNLDVATLNYTSEDASVLFGAGDGSFAPAVSIPIGDLPQGILAQDLNQDGRDDLVTTARFSDGAYVHLGQGDRSFVALGVQGKATWSRSIGSGDLDRDGIPDLVLPENFGDTVVVSFGLGDGTLEPLRIIDTDTGDAIAVDVDADGRTDLVGLDELDAFVYLGNGDGSFAAPSALQVINFHEHILWGDITAVAATDFNGDDIVDLAVTIDGVPLVSIHLGTGGGAFADSVRVAAATADAVISDDFNGDLAADLALVDSSRQDVTILLGNGDGTFGAPAAFAVTAFPFEIASGDFDQDGHRDLAITSNPGSDVSILLGNGDGTFDPETLVAVAGTPRAMDIVDLDGDGLDDLIFALYALSEVSVRLGNGNGTFGPETLYPTGNSPLGIAAADFDRDGHTDITTTHTIGPELAVLLADGAGGFRVPLRFRTGRNPSSVSAADFDGDGRVDFLVSNSHLVEIVLGKGTLPPVVRFEADKTILMWPPVFGAESYTVYRGWVSGLIDFDLDGLPDSGYGDCQNGAGTDPGFVDLQEPAPDETWFYLVGFVGPLGETGLGTTSAGLARQPSIACP